MKLSLLFSCFVISTSVMSQNLQLNYDFRHTIDPKLNPKNFPSISFEYFKNIDTLETGSFLLKMDARLDGKKSNTGQVFIQLSQSLKFWSPGIYLSLSFNGGLGVTPDAFGYYISNAYGLGVSIPFQWNGAWFSMALLFRYNAFEKPSYDPQFTFYCGKGFLQYKILAAGSFVFWTQNKNQGNEITKNQSGKTTAFFGDPQVWIKIKGGFSIGSRINVYYHVLSPDDNVQLYPTLGMKYQF